MQLNKTLGIVLVPLVLGCGNSEQKPARNDYRNQLAVAIPAYFQLASFDVEASENVGSKVEPLFRARFKATVKLKTDTYDRVREEEGATLISPVAKDGDQWEMYGIATARLSGGSWQVKFDLDNNPTIQNGRPRDFFTGKVILLGSAEESEWRAQLEAARRAAEQESARAEEVRREQESQLRAELEVQRRAAQQEAVRAAEARRIQEERERIALEPRKAVFYGKWRLTRHAPAGQAWRQPNWGEEVMQIFPGGRYELNGRPGNWSFNVDDGSLTLTIGSSRNTARRDGDTIELTDRRGGLYTYVPIRN